MKYRDIEQLPRAYYTVDIPWSYLKNWLEDHKKHNDLDMNPDFQRDYVWTQTQKEQYIEWIMRGGESGKDVYFNAPGWNTRGRSGQMVIVDGKQRINAVLEFLDNKVRAFGCALDEFEDKEIMKRDIDLGFKFHINNLNTRIDILKWYIALNTGGTQHTESEIKSVARLLEKELKANKDRYKITIDPKLREYFESFSPRNID